MKPRVNLIPVQHEVPEYLTYGKLRTPLQSWRRNYKTRRMQWTDDMTKIDEYLTNHRRRNGRLVRLLTRAVVRERKILLLTSRRAHVTLLKDALTAALRTRGLRTEVGVFWGGLSPEKWAASAGCPVILGTYQMVKEALDLPALDVMVLAIPRSDIIQSVGRILREHPGKKAPVVVDFVDHGIGLTEGMARKRQQQYGQQDWEIIRRIG